MFETLSALFSLIEQFPELIAVAMQLKKLWEQYEDGEKRAQEVKQLKEAIQDAKQTKDTTALTNLVNGFLTGKPPVTH